MMYLLIFACEMFATGGLLLGAAGNVATVNQTALLAPSVQESTNVFTGAWAVIAGVAPYLRLLVQVIFLYQPTVFMGYMSWFYWFVCFPVSVGMVASIIFIVRGVHSG